MLQAKRKVTTEMLIVHTKPKADFGKSYLQLRLDNSNSLGLLRNLASVGIGRSSSFIVVER